MLPKKAGGLKVVAEAGAEERAEAKRALFSRQDTARPRQSIGSGRPAGISAGICGHARFLRRIRHSGSHRPASWSSPCIQENAEVMRCAGIRAGGPRALFTKKAVPRGNKRAGGQTAYSDVAAKAELIAFSCPTIEINELA